MDENKFKDLADDFNDPHKRLQRERDVLQLKYQRLKTDFILTIVLIIATAVILFINKNQSIAGTIIVFGFVVFILYVIVVSIRTSIQRHNKRKIP